MNDLYWRSENGDEVARIERIELLTARYLDMPKYEGWTAVELSDLATQLVDSRISAAILRRLSA